MKVIKAETKSDNFHLSETLDLSKKKKIEAAIIAMYPVKNVNATGSSFGIVSISMDIPELLTPLFRRFDPLWITYAFQGC